MAVAYPAIPSAKTSPAPGTESGAKPGPEAKSGPESGSDTIIAAAPPAEPHGDSTLADAHLTRIVREGLSRRPKQLPPWLFYDEAGSLLFEEITRLPEYYPTRVERELLAAHAGQMIAAAAEGERLRLVELGAGSADKTRTLLAAALAHQGAAQYLPVDVSESALEMACRRIEAELPGVETVPVVADYTIDWSLPEQNRSEAGRQLLLWIGSSIGNFEPEAAEELLRRINATMQPGDGLLLGVDLAPCDGGKCVGELLAAYDDEAGVTAQFNSNMLVRLNRELGADFETESFAHWAEWNAQASRIEMHLESLREQHVRIDTLDLDVHFAAGERLHTENSYKYTLEAAAALMERAGFPVVENWTDHGEWFAVILGRKR
jgi:L-histidine Nalpha-methyltransferase